MRHCGGWFKLKKAKVEDEEQFKLKVDLHLTNSHQSSYEM